MIKRRFARVTIEIDVELIGTEKAGAVFVTPLLKDAVGNVRNAVGNELKACGLNVEPGSTPSTVLIPAGSLERVFEIMNAETREDEPGL